MNSEYGIILRTCSAITQLLQQNIAGDVSNIVWWLSFKHITYTADLYVLC